jgi:hypothetical protein
MAFTKNMTADMTIGMDSSNPEKYLNGNGQAFISKKSQEVEMFEDFMQIAFDPLCTIPQLVAKLPREQRVPGTELSYWALYIRAKKSCLQFNAISF